MKNTVYLIVLVVLLMSCNFLSTPQATDTPAPTQTSLPTFTPSPAATATDAASETPLPLLDTSEITTLVAAEGYTLSVPFPLLHQIDRSIVIVGDEARTLTISFSSDSYDGTTELTDIIEGYLSSLENRGWQFTRGDTTEIQVDQASGLAIQVTANAGGDSFEGSAIAVSPGADFILFGLGLGRIDSSGNSWQSGGEKIFEDLLASIKFIETNASCPVSTDTTYGYTEANPIKVGGGAFDGPSRERAYLDHLRGPNGEALSYERQGSLPSGDTILDIYHITGPGIDETLYIDEYNFSELQAPVGFTCNGAFPLSAP